MPLEIKQNEPLSKHTTFAIGGPAKYFAAVKTKEEVLEAIGFAESKKLPFFILLPPPNIKKGSFLLSAKPIASKTSSFVLTAAKYFAGPPMAKVVCFESGSFCLISKGI